MASLLIQNADCLTIITAFFCKLDITVLYHPPNKFRRFLSEDMLDIQYTAIFVPYYWLLLISSGNVVKK